MPFLGTPTKGNETRGSPNMQKERRHTDGKRITYLGIEPLVSGVRDGVSNKLDQPLVLYLIWFGRLRFFLFKNFKHPPNEDS